MSLHDTLVCLEYEKWNVDAMGERYMTACGRHLAPYGQTLVCMPEGGHRRLTTDPAGVTCPNCTRIMARPGYRTEALYISGSPRAVHRADDPLAVHARGGCARAQPSIATVAAPYEPEKVSCFDCCALGNGWRRGS